MAEVFIGGVPFMALGHRDGRFMRAAGLFALARRQAGGGYCILHLELTEAINRRACAAHPRWGWALGQGMDSLLVHVAGGRARCVADPGGEIETVVWHGEAEVVFGPGPGCGGTDETGAEALEQDGPELVRMSRVPSTRRGPGEPAPASARQGLALP